MRKRQAAKSSQTSISDWVVRPAVLEAAVMDVAPLVLPTTVPIRILLALPRIPPTYVCIPTFETWHGQFLEQVAQYAIHLEALYDFKVPVVITKHRDTIFSVILSWFQRLLAGNFLCGLYQRQVPG